MKELDWVIESVPIDELAVLVDAPALVVCTTGIKMGVKVSVGCCVDAEEEAEVLENVDSVFKGELLVELTGT